MINIRSCTELIWKAVNLISIFGRRKCFHKMLRTKTQPLSLVWHFKADSEYNIIVRQKYIKVRQKYWWKIQWGGSVCSVPDWKMWNVRLEHVFLSYKMVWMKYVCIYSLASGMCYMASFVWRNPTSPALSQVPPY